MAAKKPKRKRTSKRVQKCVARKMRAKHKSGVHKKRSRAQNLAIAYSECRKGK